MQVLITTLREKLPPEVRDLEDVTRPIPAGVQFFEEQLTASGTARTVGLALLLIVLGGLALAVGVDVLLDSHSRWHLAGTLDYGVIGVGAVLIFAACLLFTSLAARAQLRAAQRDGTATRFGIFLSGELLISHSTLDTTVIPREHFRGLDGAAVTYDLEGAPKSFRLPAQIVGKDRAALDAAIRSWSAS